MQNYKSVKIWSVEKGIKKEGEENYGEARKKREKWKSVPGPHALYIRMTVGGEFSILGRLKNSVELDSLLQHLRKVMKNEFEINKFKKSVKARNKASNKIVELNRLDQQPQLFPDHNSLSLRSGLSNVNVIKNQYSLISANPGAKKRK